jgi:uncharacterized membrane protein
VGSVGILLAGVVTLPLAVHFAGGQLNAVQAAHASIILFFLRWVWLYLVRIFFQKRSGNV